MPGKPATSGSKKVFPKRDGKGFIVAPDNERQKNWQAAIREAASEKVKVLTRYVGIPPDNWITYPLICTIKLKCVFIIARPKGHFGTGKNANKLKSSAPDYPAVKPDSLKLARAVEDALNGIIYRDDSQICKHEIEKVYADQLNPVIGVRIFISRLQ